MSEGPEDWERCARRNFEGEKTDEEDKGGTANSTCSTDQERAQHEDPEVGAQIPKVRRQPAAGPCGAARIDDGHQPRKRTYELASSGVCSAVGDDKRIHGYHGAIEPEWEQESSASADEKGAKRTPTALVEQRAGYEEHQRDGGEPRHPRFGKEVPEHDAYQRHRPEEVEHGIATFDAPPIVHDIKWGCRCHTVRLRPLRVHFCS